jgi:FOG: HEAT repeat
MERGACAWRSCRRGPGACDGAGRGAGRPRARGDHDCAHAGGRRGQCHGAAALSSVPGCCRARGEHRGAAGPAGSDPAVHGAAPRDGDSDVRLLATELARNMPAENATQLLCRLLEHEQHPNVCAAAIDVLAEVGTRDAVPALQPVPSDLPERRFCHSRCR